MWCVASTDAESVKPTPQRQGRDGLLLIAKRPFTLLANGRLKSTQSSRSTPYRLTVWIAITAVVDAT